mmetsp:Transcript_63753/g.132746  ORF Transcript_63753/g.132746 Transcript_63753/m.132746 type:complete len:275 (-) Transcript_63753:296-1120(-)
MAADVVAHLVHQRLRAVKRDERVGSGGRGPKVAQAAVLVVGDDQNSRIGTNRSFVGRIGVEVIVALNAQAAEVGAEARLHVAGVGDLGESGQTHAHVDLGMHVRLVGHLHREDRQGVHAVRILLVVGQHGGGVEHHHVDDVVGVHRQRALLLALRHALLHGLVRRALQLAAHRLGGVSLVREGVRHLAHNVGAVAGGHGANLVLVALVWEVDVAHHGSGGITQMEVPTAVQRTSPDKTVLIVAGDFPDLATHFYSTDESEVDLFSHKPSAQISG